MANLTLIYGLRLLPEGEVTEIEDATLKLANGHEAHVTMHSIEGSREEIEAQLKRSLDAFFDFYPRSDKLLLNRQSPPVCPSHPHPGANPMSLRTRSMLDRFAPLTRS